MVAFFEKAGGMLSYHRLTGIVVEAHAGFELVVARRTYSSKRTGPSAPCDELDNDAVVRLAHRLHGQAALAGRD